MQTATRRIVVDMTPLGPGGQNGGAGLVATSLVREIGSLRAAWEIVLLTCAESHAELAALDRVNIRRVCVRGGDTPGSEQPKRAKASNVATLARRTLALTPPRLRVRARDALWRVRHGAANARMMDDLRADLLLCPFTVPYYWRPGLRCVSILHDLQHVALPEFFSADQRLNREQHVRDACAHADRIVCVSEFVRQTLLAHMPLADRQAVAIHHGLLQTFNATATPAPTIQNLGLAEAHYLLYPANFWPHKNHARLLEALARPEAESIRLVCTGAPNAAMRVLEATARHELGPDRVIFAGYVAEQDFQALLDGCLALIYPSLYEGFGMPVLEAMARGKPILCSNAASLPEVAGDAATYFDPRNVADIARAIASLSEVERVAQQVERGRVRAGRFGTAKDMARTYVALLEEVVAAG